MRSADVIRRSVFKCEPSYHGLCDVEDQRRKDWISEHAKVCPKNHAGGDFVMTAGHQICLRPSSIGDDVTILCDCGERKNISHDEHT